MEYADYDALIFDGDGTLVDSLCAHETAWIEVLEMHGIPYTPQRMNELGGEPALAVDPARCIAFDDADGGLESARRAGMAVVDVRTIWQPADRLFTA